MTTDETYTSVPVPVKGRCPGCGQDGQLTVEIHNSRILCLWDDCLDPGAVNRLLEQGHVGESIDVKELSPGDRVRAKFCGLSGQVHIVEGDVHNEGVDPTKEDQTVYVGGPARRLRTHSGTVDPLLDEVFMLERGEREPEPDPLEVQSVIDEIYAIRYTSEDDPSVADLARELVRRNVKKVRDDDS